MTSMEVMLKIPRRKRGGGSKAKVVMKMNLSWQMDQGLQINKPFQCRSTLDIFWINTIYVKKEEQFFRSCQFYFITKMLFITLP